MYLVEDILCNFNLFITDVYKSCIFINTFNPTDNSKIQPQSKNAKVGEKIEFTCNSEEIVEWTFNGGSLMYNTKVDQRRRSIYIEHVLSQNEGEYKCIGKTKEGYIFGALSHLVVESKAKNSIITMLFYCTL